MSKFVDKRILFISPVFFGYHSKILDELAKQGAQVDFFNERPLNSSVGKILLRLKINLLISIFVKFYYDKVVRYSAGKNYDYLFLLIPETISAEHINRIKALNPNVKVVIYMWDSIKNRPHAKSLVDIADRFCTFDPKDCQDSSKLTFLPLFYIDDYKFSPSNQERKFNSCFIGTIHSDRYHLVKKIAEKVKIEGRPDFLFFYCPSYLLFLLKKIFTSELNGVPFKSISFKSLSQSEIRSIVEQSNFIIDVEHPMQVGLTMRTIEMVGARRKLITTNADVLNYDFFYPSNICFVDRLNPEIENEFASLCYHVLPGEIYNKYSLENWVSMLFDLEGRYEAITYRS